MKSFINCFLNQCIRKTICRIICSFLSDCGAKVDMVFVLDASTSVTEFNFQIVKDFMIDFLSEASIDDGSVRVGVVSFSDDDYLQFHLNNHRDKMSLLRAIDSMPYAQGSTNTADALLTMRSEMFTAGNGDRAGVPNVAIVITDGVSNINSRRTIPEAEQARADGIHIYSIGIGLTDTKELDAMASRPVEENRYSVQDFSELRHLRDDIFHALCTSQCCFLFCSSTFVNTFHISVSITFLSVSFKILVLIISRF